MKLYFDEDEGEYYLFDRRDNADFEIEVSDEKGEFIKRVFKEYAQVKEIFNNAIATNTDIINLYKERHKKNHENDTEEQKKCAAHLTKIWSDQAQKLISESPLLQSLKGVNFE